MLTLQELLAGIFAEEGIVTNGPSEICDHELEYRLNVLLGVAGVVCESSILGMLAFGNS